MKPIATLLSLAILLGTLAPFIRAEPDAMNVVPHIAGHPVLNKVDLDRVKRHIIESGARCTYVNKYNHNPCLETAEFRLFLNPDPGPDGHPQWNINCDITRGDFNTLVVQEKREPYGYHTIRFLSADRLTLRDANPQVLEHAVREVLAQLDR